MKARYGGWCKAGRDKVRPGDEVVKRGTWVHAGCLGTAVVSRARAMQYRDERGDEGPGSSDPWDRDEQDYQQGLADGARYSAEKRIYGAALAERFQAMDEFNRYWKYGEE